jgi:hypothetical protein
MSIKFLAIRWQAEEEHAHEDGVRSAVGGQQGLHLPHQVFGIYVTQFPKFQQLKSPNPAGFCTPGQHRGLELLVYVVSPHVDVPEAVLDVHEAVPDFIADLSWQGTQGVVKFGCRVCREACRDTQASIG